MHTSRPINDTATGGMDIGSSAHAGMDESSPESATGREEKIPIDSSATT